MTPSPGARRAVVAGDPLTQGRFSGDRRDEGKSGTPAAHKDGRRSWTIRQPLGIGLAALFGLFGGVVAWAATVDISGAVIGGGQVQASANRIAVQHPDGGVVAETPVRNGDRVKSGDVVVRLDDASLRSELAALESELFELLASEARLEAELDGRRRLSPHPVLAEALSTDASLRSLLDQQQRQLDAHHRSLVNEVSQLRSQASQVSDEARGIQAALAAKREELALLQEELARTKQNLQRGFSTRTAVAGLERDVSQTKGELGALEAKWAELQQKGAEQRLKASASPLDAWKLSAEKLNLSRLQSRKLIDSRAAVLNKLSRLEIRAPVSGTVFDLKILGPRSVIEAAKPIMYIVPDNRPDLVVVRVDAKDIEQVGVGQEAGLRFTTFSKRSTPIVSGRVTAVSADAFVDERTQAAYYFVDVTLNNQELKRLGEVELLPGMPVEAYLQTESRSPATYVVQPIADFFAKAFRD
jgi:HlyD family secretion protein